ncbi:MAG: hypothetical protein ACREQM_05690 [Candidatus Dormibacteraceae bacterium]
MIGRTARDYPTAKSLATTFAQCRDEPWAVVEDFTEGLFLILPVADAWSYAGMEDAEVQFMIGPVVDPRRRGGPAA